MSHKIVSLLLFVCGLYFGWQALDAVLLQLNRGAPVGEALLYPPTLLRLVSTGLIILGAGRAFISPGKGKLMALFGAILFTLLVGILIAVGADISMWQDDSVRAGLLLIGSALLFFLSPRLT